MPIEPIIGLARDPRKCWDVMVENFTQSKEHMIPKSRHLADILNGTVGKSALHDGFEEDQRRPFCSTRVRRTIPTLGRRVQNGSSIGTRAWYRHQERGGMGKETDRQVITHACVPQWLMPGYEFNNFCTETNPVSKRNPIKVIKEMSSTLWCSNWTLTTFRSSRRSCTSSRRPVAMALIDDFYFEQHFSNKAMRLHGWYRLYPVKLSYYYGLALPMREQGFRIHYWP